MDSILTNRWFSMTLIEQMINIGNEVKRATRFDSNREKKEIFLNKALAYTELTMQDPKNARACPELEICKEVLEDYKGDHKLNCTKEDINRYYMTFSLML